MSSGEYRPIRTPVKPIYYNPLKSKSPEIPPLRERQSAPGALNARKDWAARG